jgi:hypothetical protein
MTELPLIKPKRKSGGESFRNSGKHSINLSEFWQWSVSDLLSNATRGILAEFIVAKALGLAKSVRNEWDAFDLKYKGLRLEIKSAAYIQSWKQDGFSKIIFTIQPTRAWSAETNRQEKKARRQADAYVFCVLKEKNQKKINPLDLDQWDFYILKTSKINRKCPEQKSISLSKLEKLGPQKVGFLGIKKAVDVLV